MSKIERQEKILKIIAEYNVETQEDLIHRLRENGYDVTQATVSRDIRELKLVKGVSATGIQKYAISGNKSATVPKFSNSMTESITSVEHAGNITVVKTYPGMANAVATCIDSFNFSDILGCVAGDDTILIVVKDHNSARHLCEKIKWMTRTT